MTSDIQQHFDQLPDDDKFVVINLINHLEKKNLLKKPQDKVDFSFSSWQGALADLKGDFTSVGLQNAANTWRLD